MSKKNNGHRRLDSTGRFPAQSQFAVLTALTMENRRTRKGDRERPTPITTVRGDHRARVNAIGQVGGSGELPISALPSSVQLSVKKQNEFFYLVPPSTIRATPSRRIRNSELDSLVHLYWEGKSNS